MGQTGRSPSQTERSPKPKNATTTTTKNKITTSPPSKPNSPTTSPPPNTSPPPPNSPPPGCKRSKSKSRKNKHEAAELSSKRNFTMCRVPVTFYIAGSQVIDINFVFISESEKHTSHRI